MKRVLFAAVLVAIITARPASAEIITIFGGEHTLLPGVETEIPIIARAGGLEVSAVETYFEIEGRSGPTITNVTLDSAGTLFEGNTFGGENVVKWSPFVWAVDTLTESGTVTVDGDVLLAKVWIDTTDVAPGQYTLMLKGVLADVFGEPGLASSFPEYETLVWNGTLNVVPEPSSIVMMGGLLICGAVLVTRRRRKS